MMKGMLKRCLGVVAAAAMAVTGMAALTGTANADGEVTGDTTFTFTASSAEQLTGRDLAAYKIGDYVNYGNEDNPDWNMRPAYGVRTSDEIPATIENEPNTVIKDALVAAGASIPSPEPSDLLTWAMQQTGVLDQSADRPWDTDQTTGAQTRKFAEYLAANLGKLGDSRTVTLNTPTQNEDGTGDDVWRATATLNEPGVWLIVDNTKATDSTITQAVPMLVYSGTQDEDTNLTDIFTGATVNLKSTKNVDKGKTVDKTSVSVGDTLTYTLTGVVANPAPASFGFVDKPGVGLTIDTTNVKVYACANDNNKPCVPDKDAPGADDTDGVTTLTAGTDYTTDFDGLDTTAVPGEYRGDENAKFTVTLTNTALDAYKGKMVTVVYTATVNTQAPGQGQVVNKIVQNDGKDYQVTTNLNEFKFQKVDAQDNPLKGATFKIERCSDSLCNPAEALTNYPYQLQDSDEDGMVTFPGLAAGWYLITEVSAPNGYMGYDANKNGNFLSFAIEMMDDGSIGNFTADVYGLVTATDYTKIPINPNYHIRARTYFKPGFNL